MLKQVASGVLCVDLVSLLITLGLLWSMANSNHDALSECSWCLPCIDVGSNNSCKSRQPYEYVQKVGASKILPVLNRSVKFF